MLQNPFRQAREMDGVQKALAGLPGAVFYGAALLLITAAGALGYTAGSRAPGEQMRLPSHTLHTLNAFSSDLLCYIPDSARALSWPMHHNAEALPSSFPPSAWRLTLNVISLI